MLLKYVEILHFLLWLCLVTDWSHQNEEIFIRNLNSLQDLCGSKVLSNDSGALETTSKIFIRESCGGNAPISLDLLSVKCLAENIKLHFFNNVRSGFCEDNLNCYLCVICNLFNITKADLENSSDIEICGFKNIRNDNFCKDVSENCTSLKKLNNENDEEEDEGISLKKLVVLTIVLIVCFVSLLGNGILVIICTCHRKMRTDCNKIILNLAISDILFVLLNSYIYTCDTFLMYTCSDLVFFKTFSYYTLNCVCSYNVAALSLQRYLAVVSAGLVQPRLLKFLRPISIITFIWVFSIIITSIFVTYLLYGFDVHTEVLMFVMFAIYCFIPLVIVGVCSIMTSYRIKKFHQEIPGEALGHETIRRARITSSNVLIALIIIFTISYVPYYFIAFIKDYFYIDYNKYHQQKFSEWLVILNSVFNPLALYVVSGKFRKYFNGYILFKCKNKRYGTADSKTGTVMTNVKN